MAKFELGPASMRKFGLTASLNDRFAPEAAGREAFGQNLSPHPKRSKPSCQRLTHGEQLRSKCSAILTSDIWDRAAR